MGSRLSSLDGAFVHANSTSTLDQRSRCGGMRTRRRMMLTVSAQAGSWETANESAKPEHEASWLASGQRLISATDFRNANECLSVRAVPYCTAQPVLDFHSPVRPHGPILEPATNVLWSYEGGAPSSDSSLAPERSRLIGDGAWPALGLACTTDAGTKCAHSE